METPTRQRLTTSGLIFRNDQVLLLKRSAHETFLPGHYDLPGGKVDLGESVERAVLREVKEEAGLATSILGIYNVWDWISFYKDEPTQFISISYALEINGEPDVNLGPGFDDFTWANATEVLSLPMTEQLRNDVLKGFDWYRRIATTR